MTLTESLTQAEEVWKQARESGSSLEVHTAYDRWLRAYREVQADQRLTEVFNRSVRP